jgi:EAL domain-containing protein (putative c-di-GMP-specific phosphodiesterase class I)
MIDDFGTAYSSLAHLKKLPIDAIKIDQSFIRDLSDGASGAPTDASIVRAIVALGRSMNLKIIAEGIETEAQRNFLRVLGCDEGQGYLWSKPVPADELPTQLRL